MAAQPKHCDILIIGAGPVGTLLAGTLARGGLDVVLAERGRLQKDPESADPGPAAPVPDTRGYALSAGSMQLLDDLGFGAALAAQAAPIREIHVSRHGGLGSVTMDARSQGVPALGQVVPAAHLEAILAGALAPTGVRILEQTQCTALAAEKAARREVTLEGPDGHHRLAARLVIAADGTQSATRTAAGIEVRRRRYAADALVFDVIPARAHRGRAFERFTPEGPVALLPQASGHMNVVWVAPPEVCDARLALPEAARMAALQACFGWRLGRLRAFGPIARFPLEQVRAQRLHAERLALVGNVAHGLHPVAGQGLNLALRDVAVLAGLVLKAIDPGAPEVLAGYARARSADIDRVTAVTDFLARGLLMSGDGFSDAIGHVLGSGMLALDRIDPLRRFFAAQAMGLQPLPRHTLRALPPLGTSRDSA